MLTPAELARYSRHLSLEEIGVEGQQRLAAARVLVVGLGGLGSPAALYLAAAGIGTLGIADFDEVEDHNLQRQVLFDSAAVGRAKVASAAARLRAANPFIRIVEHPDGVTPGNALALFSSYDVVVDATDTFPARYLNSDAAALAGKPVVHGSVYKFEGQVTVFDVAGNGPCYRCLYPRPPPPGSVPACGEAGVVGALCGIMGSLQALETVKLVAGIGEPLRGRVLVFDALNPGFHSFAVARNPDCPVCGGAPSIRELNPGDYAGACGTAPRGGPEYPMEISVEQARSLLEHEPGKTMLIDVREPFEVEICRVPGSEHIPLRQIPLRAGSLPANRRLLAICHSGQRSLVAAGILRAHGHGSASSVAGGIDAWARLIDPQMRRY
jgi:adenylyltransferase/sulfurtransferase